MRNNDPKKQLKIEHEKTCDELKKVKALSCVNIYSLAKEINQKNQKVLKTTRLLLILSKRTYPKGWWKKEISK